MAGRCPGPTRRRRPFRLNPVSASTAVRTGAILAAGGCVFASLRAAGPLPATLLKRQVAR